VNDSDARAKYARSKSHLWWRAKPLILLATSLCRGGTGIGILRATTLPFALRACHVAC